MLLTNRYYAGIRSRCRNRVPFGESYIRKVLMQEICSMDFKQINCFLTIAECKSFTDAAAKLYISQPGVSRQIANMETELGFPLFVRGKRLLELTPAGEVMQKTFQNIIQRYEQGIQKALQVSYRDDKFCLGIAHFIPLAAFPQIFRSCLIQTEDSPIFVEYNSPPALNKALQSQQYDAIITLKAGLNIPQNLYITRTILTTPVLLVYPRSFLEGKETLGLQALSGHNFYIPEAAYMPDGYTFASDLCKSMGIEPANILTVRDTNTLFYFAEAEQGVILLDNYARQAMQSPNLTYSPTPAKHEFVLVAAKNCKHPVLERMMQALGPLELE